MRWVSECLETTPQVPAAIKYRFNAGVHSNFISIPTEYYLIHDLVVLASPRRVAAQNPICVY